MNVSVLLDLLLDVEDKMDAFYTWCAHEYRTDHQAVGLFHRLSIEEKAHKNLIAYQQRMAKTSPNDYRDIHVNPSAIKNCARQIDFFQNKKGRTTLAEAIQFAIEIECSAAESHFPELITQSNPKLHNVMRGLKAGDDRHIGLLREFAAKRGYES